jgi:hypothetical protein
MACDLTGGRLRPCKDAVGGIKKVHFVDFGDLGTLSIGSNDITLMMLKVILHSKQILHLQWRMEQHSSNKL